MTSTFGIFIGIFCFFLSPSPAHAARSGVVEAQETTVYLYPDKRSAQVIKLHKDTPLVASNFPTLGFHKVRLRSLLVGWVDATHLSLQSIPPPNPDPLAEGADASGVCAPGSSSPSSDSTPSRDPQSLGSPKDQPAIPRAPASVTPVGNTSVQNSLGIPQVLSTPILGTPTSSH
ncbi:MAG: hypothetical protein ACO3A2_01330 [Bdellovibrionia bacterium]